MPGLIKRPRTGFNRAPFRLSDMKRLEDLVDSRPTPTERGKWSKEDIRRIARLFTPEAAAGRLQEIAKRPDIDKTRLAKNVAPIEADTAEEVNAQLRWYRNPRRMDLEGIDAPKGTATPFLPRKRKLPRGREQPVVTPQPIEPPVGAVEGRPEPLAVSEPSPLSPGKDYILTDKDVFDRSPARRFESNLEAIQLVKQLENEDRLAKPEEQAILAQYSGFGDSAFSPAFARFTREDIWKERGDKLRGLVTPEEYSAIERSRLNAFYTTPEVVNAIWKATDRMGVAKLQRPRVLEPSAGSGRFLGLQPVDMAVRSRRTAVELDELTGQMLKHLYPNSDIYAGSGYQDVPIPDNSIDVAISNVPFGDFPVTDKEFGKGRRFLTRQIHNYFFAKTGDKLRPGGVLAFVTSHNTLDAPTARPIREALAEKMDMVGAIRLPKGAFPDTEVVTDIIFMRKRLPGEEPGDDRWTKTGIVTLAGSFRDVDHNVNQYFLDHPENVLGKHAATGSQYRRDEYSVEPIDQNLADALNRAVQRLPEDIIDAPAITEPLRDAPTATGSNAREGSYVIGDDGKLLAKRNRLLVPANLSGDNTAQVVAMMGVRDAARAVLENQLRNAPEEEISQAQQELTQKYDTFTAAHGALNSKSNAQLMRSDPDGAFLKALERPEGKGWAKDAYLRPEGCGRAGRAIGNHSPRRAGRDPQREGRAGF